jgi:hypothetical protein
MGTPDLAGDLVPLVLDGGDEGIPIEPGRVERDIDSFGCDVDGDAVDAAEGADGAFDGGLAMAARNVGDVEGE